MANNLATVQQIYSCFAQGDVPGILAQLADEVTFFNDADPQVAPSGGTFKGKDGVLQFFMALGSTTQTINFQPSNFKVEGNQVINEVQHDGMINSTGKSFSVKASFIWTFNEVGQVIDWKGTGDFGSFNAAFLN